jgi:predicted ferric reductase
VIAVAGTTLHVFGVNYHVSTPGTRWLWYAIPLACAALLVYVRAVKPTLALRRPYRIEQVEPERGRARTIRVRPDGHAGLRFRAGQFAWFNWRSSPFTMREHPFSISSSAERPDTVGFTVKELGDFSAALAGAVAGERVYLDGPYGSFCPDRHPAPGYVFVAGGIGIAPILSILRTLADRGDRRPLRLIYAYKDLESLTGREELERLTARLDLRITLVLSQPAPDWTGERGFLTRAIFERALPADYRDYHYFVCGPGPVLALAERELRGLGVGYRRIHAEIFDLV